jgi:cobaltochelatase CobN
LSEELSRVVRGRLGNPRWIAAMLGHGHRGVAEIAQGVDALYAFAATAGASGTLFDAVHAAIIADDDVRRAMLARNPAAVAAIASRLRDALRRGLWTTRRNAVDHELARTLAEAGT